MLRVTRGDLDLLVVHSPAGVCVIDDRCPHMSAPLSLGTLDDCLVACPLHRGQFDLATGGVVQFPTTGGLDADGTPHPPWTPVDTAIQARADRSQGARPRPDPHPAHPLLPRSPDTTAGSRSHCRAKKGVAKAPALVIGRCERLDFAELAFSSDGAV
jgi:nitrite reductase/ring-hydroxylating ferredoxin subunit